MLYVPICLVEVMIKKVDYGVYKNWLYIYAKYTKHYEDKIKRIPYFKLEENFLN